MDERDEAQLARVLEVVTVHLGVSLAAVYLHGSAVLGGLRPTSDLDVLVVTTTRPGEATRRALVLDLLAISGRRAVAPGRPVELTVVTHDALSPWSHPAVVEFQYGEWLREEYEAGQVPGPVRSADLTVLLDTAQRHGRALVGPSPSELLPAIPQADLVSASVGGVDGLVDDLVGDERNVLLTLARVASTVADGRVVPKDVAADAVARRLSAAASSTLRLAAADYLGERAEDWPSMAAEVRRCARELVTLVDPDLSRSPLLSGEVTGGQR